MLFYESVCGKSLLFFFCVQIVVKLLHFGFIQILGQHRISLPSNVYFFILLFIMVVVVVIVIIITIVICLQIHSIAFWQSGGICMFFFLSAVSYTYSIASVTILTTFPNGILFIFSLTIPPNNVIPQMKQQKFISFFCIYTQLLYWIVSIFCVWMNEYVFQHKCTFTHKKWKIYSRQIIFCFFFYFAWSSIQFNIISKFNTCSPCVLFSSLLSLCFFLSFLR